MSLAWINDVSLKDNRMQGMVYSCDIHLLCYRRKSFLLYFPENHLARLTLFLLFIGMYSFSPVRDVRYAGLISLF